ncbi:hypothetical protein Zmor_019258 [Zophobas morio]|uniref:Uncharacterized protein n=1 Tax=Zophobas morio TaxID=2755281 RepID=A0AA38M915_9CUCU|nr:hypothetical protein Zmor_019258 [Zophobas morio]
MTTPTKKHSQQRSGINSLADNVRRCFKWRNKCVCTVGLPHPNSCGPELALDSAGADLWRTTAANALFHARATYAPLPYFCTNLKNHIIIHTQIRRLSAQSERAAAAERDAAARTEHFGGGVRWFAGEGGCSG